MVYSNWLWIADAQVAYRRLRQSTKKLSWIHVRFTSSQGASKRKLCEHMRGVVDPNSGAFLTPGSGILDPWWVKDMIRIQDEHPGSYFRELRNNFLGYKYLNFFLRIRIRDPESFWPWIRDEKFVSGIRNKHPGSAKLHTRIVNQFKKAFLWKLFQSHCFSHFFLLKQLKSVRR
jgi:hypothetical protein